jgi:hypothetical protein
MCSSTLMFPTLKSAIWYTTTRLVSSSYSENTSSYNLVEKFLMIIIKTRAKESFFTFRKRKGM